MSSLRLFTAVCCLAAPLTFAQATRTWISGVGDDANPCSRTAPCSSLAGALPRTAAHGEIDLLDAMALGAATITKSITIVAQPQLGGVTVSPSVAGLTINAPGQSITLRGLSFEANQSGVSALRIVDAASVRLERCRLNGFSSDAIDARTADGGLLFIDDTSVRGSLAAGLVVSSSGAPLRAVLRGSSFTGNARGVEAAGGALVTVIDGVVSDNVDGLLVSGSAEVNLEGVQLTHNGLGAQALETAVIRLSNSNVTANSVSPTHVRGAGVVESFGNNRILGGSQPGCPAGAVVLDPVTLAPAVVGMQLTAVTLGATGVLGAVTYGATGTMPSGVGFNAGVFSGAPTQVGVFPVTLTATDFNGCVGGQAASLTVSCPSLSVTPAVLPAATTGVALTPVQFALAGSTSSTAQFVLTGALPIGVSFVNGTLLGMPTQGGTYPLTVAGTDGFTCTAQGMVTLNVGLAPGFQATTLALSTTTSPAFVSAPVIITANLTFASGTPTGTVTFSEGGSLLGITPLVGGQAVFTASMLGLGTHQISATYSGDATFGGSIAPDFPVEVVLAPTVTSLSAFGTRFSVGVTSVVGAPSGDVEVTIDGAAAVRTTLDVNGQARFDGPTTLGTHVATATYLGTATRFAPSTSMEASYTVSPPEVDAGPMMEVDAGDGEPMKPAGCGCTSADAGLSLLGLIALALRRRATRAG